MSFGRKLKAVDKQSEDGHYTLQKYLSTPAAGGAGDGDEDDNSDSEREPLNWEDQLAVLNQDLRSPSTKLRTGALRALKTSCESLNQRERMDVLKLLAGHILRFNDKSSVQLAVSLLDLVCAPRSDDEKQGALPAAAAHWLVNECDKIFKSGQAQGSTTAATTRHSLLAWANTIATKSSATSLPSWSALVAAQAQLYASLQEAPGKASLQHSSLVITRRAVRNNPDAIPDWLKALTPQHKPQNAPLLGLVVGVALRLRAKQFAEGKPRHGEGKTMVQAAKNDILSFYTATLLSSKTPASEALAGSLDEFIQLFVTVDDLKPIATQMDKMCLRSPEAILPSMCHFYSAFDDVTTLSQLFTTSIDNQLQSLTKSTNPAVRAGACRLFNVLIQRASPEATSKVVASLADALKAGKSTSADQRAARAVMLASVQPGDLSNAIVQAVVALLSKETSEVALQALMNTFARHAPATLPSASADLAKILVKSMTDAKAPLRKLACEGVGQAVWAADSVSEAFQDALLPALETNLKNASTTPLTNAAGPLEGYIAAALLEHSLNSSKAKGLAESNPVAQTLLQTGTKPSFLVWDKVVRRADTEAEQVWLCRAVLSTLLSRQTALGEQAAELAGGELGQPIVHVVVNGSTYAARSEALKAAKTLISEAPALALKVLPTSLSTAIVKLATPFPQTPADDEKVSSNNSPVRLQQILIDIATSSASKNEAFKANLMVDLALVAHHPFVVQKGDLLWIRLLQLAQLSPQHLVSDHREQLINAAMEALLHGNDASGRQLMTSLSIVSPLSVVPELSEKINTNLSDSSIAAFTQTDIAIFRHTSDQPYINPLADKKSDTPTKGKGAADKKWDEEVRKSLAAKQKVTTPALSKADQALVKAQLAQESETREKVAAALARVQQALSAVESLLASRSEIVLEELSAIAQALGSFSSRQLARLVAGEVYAVWLGIASLCLPEDSEVVTAAANVTLEAHRAVVLPDESIASMAAMATRVLYRLKFTCELKPLQPHVFDFISSLVFFTLAKGGMGVPADDKDTAVEQMALAIDILAAHCHAANDPMFPRLRMAECIIAVLMQHPQLTRQATTALTTLGEAIADNATPDELSTLLRGTLAQESHIRLACLQSLQHADLTDFNTSAELWLGKEDEDDRNAKLADAIWIENGLDLPEEFISLLLAFLEDGRPFVRHACARAFAPALQEHPEKAGDLVQALTKLYHEKNKILKPEYDNYGMVIEETLNREDPWRCRVAIAKSFKSIAESLQSSDTLTLFDLLLSGGALGDRSGEVRSEMLAAAGRVIEIQGRRDMSSLIDVFDSQLGRPESAFGDQFTADRIKEAMVILYGGLARHMEANDPRVSATVERLLDALRTPSEVVQIAVADCLPPLVKLRRDETPLLVDRLMTQLSAAPKYAERRGAAYGLAGVIKGRGISALKEFDIVTRLKDALEDKKNVNGRQGALFAVETLSITLGRIFEPYIIQILPYLLGAMGDGTVEVREATQDASKAIMSKVSGHAVKLILPSLLSGLEDRQWRSKKGAIEMLGAMANLAPRQLAISLPAIVPRLAEVLTDTHSQVRAAGNASLKRFGEVITNPEIQAVQNVILDALVDPASKTAPALDALIATSFAHFIDASSLALVVPILDRGLRERSSEIKRKSAQIVGNMATLTDARDLSPYLGQLTPLVRTVLVDPVPEARATAAKALGGLVERLGEDSFPDLVASLLEVLRTEGSGIDQQGAAQGLAEILGGLGVERLEDLFPDILDSTSSPRAHVREGFMSLLVFLPSVFGDRFTPYLNRIITPVLSGLADASDFVRDASMRAGRMIVTSHSQKAVDLLLPELEQGLFDSAWRIRQSSMQLIGELLFRIVGITSRTEQLDEEDKPEEESEHHTGEASKKALLEVLGKERRDRVLASIYIVRQDTSGLVRQLSVHIWKALVANTPRMIREVLPSLISILVKTLSSPGHEQRDTASRTLGELCRRLGDRILGDVLPILREAASAGPKSREGVCRAYIEIMQNCDEEQLQGHEAEIASAVRVLLVDDDEGVRSAAAKAFDTMQHHMGSQAIDATIPTLLQNLDQGGTAAEASLAALKEITTVQAPVVVPVLIPALIKQPITLVHAQALASLIDAAGESVSTRLVTILTALVKSGDTKSDEATAGAIDEAVCALFAAIKDITGLNSIMMHLLGLAKDPAPAKRVSACNLFAVFCENATIDHSDFDAGFLRQLVSLFDDPEQEVVQAAWKSLTALVATLSKGDMESLSVALRRTVENTGSDHKVPGFCLPNGIKPVLPIFLQGLLAGTAEQREQSAYGLGDLVERTTPEAIKPFVSQITGPLIRILGERVPAPVKTAVLTSLTTLLRHIPALIRPFYPQIQRTFVKNLGDATSQAVRTRAGNGLAALMAHQPRIDPLVTELLNGAAQSEEQEIRDAFAVTLPKIMLSGGKNISPAARSGIVSYLEESFAAPGLRESQQVSVANTLAALGKLEPELIRPLLQNEILEGPITSKTSITLRSLAETAPESLEALGLTNEVHSRVLACVGVADQPAVSRPAREARDVLKL